MTISVSGIVDLSGRTKTTAVADQVVAFSADTFTVLVYFIRVAGRGTETEVLYVSSITRTRFCLLVIG